MKYEKEEERKEEKDKIRKNKINNFYKKIIKIIHISNF